MRIVVHVPGDEKPGRFEQDVAVLNVWCEFAIANMELGEPCVTKVGGGGWDVSFECPGMSSFPAGLINKRSLPEWLASYDTELSILGTVPGDGSCDWDEVSDGATASFWDGDACLGNCPRCRFVMSDR